MAENSVESLARKILDGLQRAATDLSIGDLQRAVDQWADTNLVAITILTDKFEGLTSGQRQIKTLEWLKDLTPDERSQIATYVLLSHEDIKRRHSNMPSSGAILGIGGLDEN